MFGAILFAAGTVLGCIAMSKLPADKLTSLMTFFSSSAEQGRSAHFLSVYKRCLLDNLKYICIYFVLSLTVYSSWLCFAIPGVKGFAAGFTSLFLIKNYGVHGVVYALLGVCPSTILVIPVQLFAAVVCINFSHERIRRRELGFRAALGVSPALAVIYGIMAIASLYDAVISPALFKSLF